MVNFAYLFIEKPMAILMSSHNIGSFLLSTKYAKVRNLSNQNPNLALEIKTAINQHHKQPKHRKKTCPTEGADPSKKVATQQTKPN